MTYRLSASIVLIGAVLGISVAHPSFAQERREPRRCYGIRAMPAEETNRYTRRTSAVISASEARDILLEISLSERLASLPVRVKLFTPRDTLYQVLDARAHPAPDTGRRRRARILAARLSVAGTQITNHGLFGEWRAEVYVDGSETPCLRPLEFSIEP